MTMNILTLVRNNYILLLDLLSRTTWKFGQERIPVVCVPTDAVAATRWQYREGLGRFPLQADPPPTPGGQNDWQMLLKALPSLFVGKNIKIFSQ